MVVKNQLTKGRLFVGTAYDGVSIDIHHRLQDKMKEIFEIVDEIPESREVSIAKTKVEEALMWAGKGIARAQVQRESKGDL